jgi:purine/pyrimidine-nucleoside phosphorylase
MDAHDFLALRIPNGDSMQDKIDDVSVVLKANVYFDGKVVSHSILFRDGSRKTVGLIYPGTYIFNTAAPERMDIVAGQCRYKLKDADEWLQCAAGNGFEVPGNSSFEIAVDSSIAEYLCSYK